MRKRPLLALLAAAGAPRPAATFVPPLPPTPTTPMPTAISVQQDRAQGASSIPRHGVTGTTALSVSKKNKEGRAAAAAADDLQRARLRGELEHSLRIPRDEASAAKGKAKPSAVARNIKKLLHDADRAGLSDIGDEARILAAEAYAAVRRDGEAVRILAAVTDRALLADRPGAAFAGLAAHVGEEKWERAADFARMLFDGDRLRLPLEGEEMEGKARRLAVLAYARSDRRERLDDAMRLVKNSNCGEMSMTTTEYGAVLGGLLRSERPREARELYRQALDLGTLLTSDAASSAEVDRVGLSIAGALADVSLAADAIGRLKPKLSTGDILTALQTFQNIGAASAEHVAFAKELVEALARAVQENTGQEPLPVDDVDSVGKVFSFLLLDCERENVLELVEASKLIRTKANWPKWLSKDSRAAILPTLLELKRIKDAMEIFLSLDINADCLSEYADMSSDFWSAALCLCYEKPSVDEGRKVGPAILSQGHPLNNDIDTLIARVLFTWERYFNNNELSASKAQKEIDRILSLASSAQNKGGATRGYSHLIVEGTVALMSIHGKEAEIDRLNERFFATIDSSIYGELSDLEVFQLRKHRYFALATAWAKKDTERYFSLLFPEGDFGRRRVADIPLMGGLTKAQNFLNGFDSLFSKMSGNMNDERALQDVTEQALLCDEAAGDSKCMDEFVEEYHEVLKSLWRNLSLYLDFLACQFPSVPSNAPLNPTKLDTIKERLWGEQCRAMFLDLMKDGECQEGWMHQEESGIFECAENEFKRSSLELWAEVIYVWYQSPVFEYEKINDAYQKSRKESVKKFVSLLFEKELSKAKDVGDAIAAAMVPNDSTKKKKKKAEKQINDLTTWTAAAKSFRSGFFPRIVANTFFRNKNLEESNDVPEAYSLAMDVITEHPSVRFLNEEKKKAVLYELFCNDKVIDILHSRYIQAK